VTTERTICAPAGRGYRSAAALALVALAQAGCEGISIGLPFDDAEPRAVEQAYELRYRRTVGEALRYQATYGIRYRAEPSRAAAAAPAGTGMEVDEDITADLLVYTTGKTEGAQSFDRVVLRRHELKRSMLEVAPNGKVTNREDVRDMQPTVTPNTEYEPALKGTGMRYIPMDELGCIARRKETPYHYAAYDSLCYVFPVFPRQAVRVGDTWRHSFPVIVGWEYTKNEFVLHSQFTLEDVRRLKAPAGGEGALCAVVRYKYYGLLDTAHAEDADKMPEGVTGLLWRRDVVEGEGLAYFDIKEGRVAWRREKYTVSVEREFERPRRSDEKARKETGPVRETFRSRNTVEFTCRLLGPGERASERPARM